MEKLVKRLDKHKYFLSTLATSKPRKKRIILNNSDCKTINLICELSESILYGYIPISQKEKEHLKKYKILLEKLCQQVECSSDQTLNYKKELLGQSGGFLNILIPAVVTGIASIISSFISRPNHTTEEEK